MSDSCRWYEPDPSNLDDEHDRAVALLTETAAIETRQSSWNDLNLWNTTLFANRELPGFRWGATAAEGELWPANLRTENLIEEIGSALLSRACSSPLKPTPVPHGPSYKVERAVRELDRFITGAWRGANAEEAAVMAFLDAYLCGLGCVKTVWDKANDCLAVQSVFFDNLVIDNREAANRRDPRHYRIRQVLPRSAVEAEFGPLEKQDRYCDHRNVEDGYVVVVEAWRLPAKDQKGRHTVACCGKLLVDEEWKHDWVPLSFFHWEDPISGFLGRSGVELLVPFQVQLNQLNDDIAAGQDVACRTRILYHVGSQLDFSQWDSGHGRFVGYAGVEPKPFSIPSNLLELYQERERIRQAAHQYAGLSTMTAQAELPQGVRMDSSMGIREFRNMEDARHLRRWVRFEQFRLGIAKIMMKVLGNSKGADDYTVRYMASRVPSKAIPYSAIKTLNEDHYSWTMDATPMTMMSPAARREVVRDWSSRGLSDQGDAKRMDGAVNLELIDDLEMASYDDILRHLDLMEDEKYEAPTELTNLTYGIPRVTQNYHRLRRYDDVPQGVLDYHLQWILTGAAIQTRAAGLQQQLYPGPQGPTAFAPTQGMPGTSASTSPRTVVYANGANGNG